MVPDLLPMFVTPTARRIATLFLVVQLTASLGAASGTKVPDGWFVWPSVEPVSGSATDASALNAAPAGAAGRILVKDGQFVTPDGQRVRFWGCNLSGEVAFPPTGELAPLARRLAKGGVNIARLHHLDNTWATANGGSLWSKDEHDHLTVNPAQLDRLHQLIAALKAAGIYANLNLKVSKSLVPADGFADTVRQLPVFQKRVDIFDRRMIDLQKEYARQLLTTKNPYTGLAPAEDPAVAVIELNNENSLLGFWTRDLGRGLDRLPEPFRAGLTAQWNAWLAARYADDGALAAAWNAAATDTPTNAAIIPAGAIWVGKATGGAELKIVAGADASSLEIHVARITGVNWHSQAILRGVTLVDGEVYTLSFLARSNQARSFGVGVGLDQAARPNENWRGFGLLDTAQIGPDWTPVRFVFSAHSANGAPAALQLNAGDAAGVIAIKEFSLVRGGEGIGLLAGQSARAGTVPIPTKAGKQQWADWIHFLAHTERKFADEMRSYLKDELGVTAPIVCSQIEYGGLTGVWREQQNDFADTHAYWQHPDLENGDFGSSHWTIRNSPQVAVFGPGSVGDFAERALMRIAGKPYALSEYDHAAPSEFACEMYPTLATFACRQDWDAIYPFDIGMTGSRNRDGTIGRFFDQLNHPAKWGFSPFAALVFRTQLVARAPKSAQLELAAPPWTPHMHADLAWRAVLPDEPIDFLNTRFAINDSLLADDEPRVLVRSDGDERVPLTLTAAPQGQVYVINAAQAAGAVGFLGGATIDAGTLRVTCDRFGRDFGAVTAVALDGKSLESSRRILVTIAARAQNQGLVWNADRTSVGADWGHGPPIAERVPATITLGGAMQRTVYALRPDGSRGKKVPANPGGGDGLTFSVGPRDNTLHYEIVAQ